MLTQDRLKELVDYCPGTGTFTLKKYRGGRVKAGEKLGSMTSKGYIDIKVDGKTYKAHRLAFVYMEGSAPNEVDHINRVRDDNRWSNLRAITRGDNCRNRGGANKDGLPSGIYRHRRKFKVMVGVDYNPIYLGLFNTVEEAEKCRSEFIEKIMEENQ